MDISEIQNYLKAQHDPERYEQSFSFDRVDSEKRFNRVVAELEKYFGGACYAVCDHSIQDASFFAEVALPRALFDDVVLLRFSAFGNMVAFRDESELDAASIQEVAQILSRNGFVFIPEAAFAGFRYDGEYAERFHHSWWFRFFDYV